MPHLLQCPFALGFPDTPEHPDLMSHLLESIKRCLYLVTHEFKGKLHLNCDLKNIPSQQSCILPCHEDYIMGSLRYHHKMSISRVSKTSAGQARQTHLAALLMIHMSKWTFQIHTGPPEQMPQTSRPSQLSHLQEDRRHNISICYY